MKKTLLLGLVISLGLGVTACNSTENESNDVINEKQQSEQKSDNKDYKDKKFIYGKVKSIVGNEIEFELANKPEKDIEEIEKEKYEELENEKGEIPAATMTASIEATDEKKVVVGDIEKNEPLVELEFTSKLKDIIIPPTAKINILTPRSGEGLSAIGEGRYLRLEVDDDKSENPTILSIDIIS